ncbi:hypothetical protein HDU83_006223 [Entophlyctis luteolus]|nr:hypothetical protein HDU83_006223 [Entophlyctis luteolus]
MNMNDDSNMNGTTMPVMALHFTYGDTVLFGAVTIADATNLLALMIFTFVISVAHTAARSFLVKVVNDNQESETLLLKKKKPAALIAARMPVAIVSAVAALLVANYFSFLLLLTFFDQMWILMLIVMTFNAALLLAAVAGTFVGTLVFGPSITGHH